MPAKPFSALPKKPVSDMRQASATRLQGLSTHAVEALERNLSCGNPEAEIAAAQAILEFVFMPEAAYSLVGHISNRTDHTLVLKSANAGGNWLTKPPAAIAPGDTGDFRGDYDGFHYEGTVIYTAAAAEGEFVMTWSIPLFGDNNISDTSTISGTFATHEGGRGWHAEVWYFLKSE